MNGKFMTTKIDVIGESSFIIDTGSFVVITDPWFGESIYGGAWSQFPLPKVNPKQLQKITHIFISHVHADHCCLSSINKILSASPEAEILIMDRLDMPCYLSKKLASAFNKNIIDRITKLKPYNELQILNTRIWALAPSGDNSLNALIDSSLLIATSEGLILFCNDDLPCDQHAEFVNGIDSNQFLALLPFSGGSGYPSSYENIQNEACLAIASNIRDNYAAHAIKFLNKTNFKYFMPVAGNHIIVSKSYSWHEKTSFLLNPYTAIRKAKQETSNQEALYSYPCEDLDFVRKIVDNDNIDELENIFEFEKRLFIESVSSRILPTYLSEGQPIDVEVIENRLRSYGKKIKHELKELAAKNSDLNEAIIYVTIGNNLLRVDHQSWALETETEHNSFDYVKSIINDNSLAIDIDVRFFPYLVDKSIHVNEADAAGLLKYWRTMPYYPNIYAMLFEIIH